MPRLYRFPAAACACLLAACSGPQKPAPVSASSQTAASPVRITQLYATAPKIVPGEKSLICYGVENGTKVWLSPPRQELSAALARCVEVEPRATTAYTLTAEGAAGPPVSQNLTIRVGPPRAHIVDVTISSLAVKPGDPVSICFHAEHAAAVDIAPLHYRAPNPAEGCTLDHPQKTTAYVVTAAGAAGDKDTEHVTVKVQ